MSIHVRPEDPLPLLPSGSSWPAPSRAEHSALPVEADGAPARRRGGLAARLPRARPRFALTAHYSARTSWGSPWPRGRCGASRVVRARRGRGPGPQGEGIGSRLMTAAGRARDRGGHPVLAPAGRPWSSTHASGFSSRPHGSESPGSPAGELQAVPRHGAARGPGEHPRPARLVRVRRTVLPPRLTRHYTVPPVTPTVVPRRDVGRGSTPARGPTPAAACGRAGVTVRRLPPETSPTDGNTT
ncbi:hypothetical protein QJS66_15670 [Kocuria rhizophila]|nr:hypothetical protein QJS66_15670 [Kocuria rhizophila]